MVRKIAGLLAVFILLVGLAAGCGKKENKPGAPPADKPQSAQEDSAKSGSGTYNGQIDGNSVEINFNGEDKAFRLSEEVKPVFEGGSIKEGDKVSFKYHEDQYGRLVITGLDKA
mgnify:CR=1 FL=1